MKTWEEQLADVFQRLAAARVAGLDTRSIQAELDKLRATRPRHIDTKGVNDATG